MLATGLSNCRKERLEVALPGHPQAALVLPTRTNPFSVRNVAKAKAQLAGKAGPATARVGSGSGKQFIYFKFSPDLDTDQFTRLEHDSTVHLLEIPFANMSIYGQDFALDTEKAEKLKDGSIYGVTALDNQDLLKTLEGRPETQLQRLDTLVQVAEADTALQYKAFQVAGISEAEIARWRICLFQRPHGRVQYWDNQFSRYEPVRGMEVWSLFLGIPIYTYSDGKGDYEIPWRYSIGTIMGTKAKNPRVNVKPLDIHGTIARSVYTIVTQFIVGSIHIEGWVTPCEMKDGKDFTFDGHTQVRYWSQVLNAYYFHDQYCDQEGILRAPTSMVCYALWANTHGKLDRQGKPLFSPAATPMLGHLRSPGSANIQQLFLNLFDGEDITNYPTLFNIIFGLLPDMAVSVPEGGEPSYYNCRLTQIAMHELSHASHYRRVGDRWWTDFIQRTVHNSSVQANPYGNPDDYIDVGESWAEFLGINYALRRYSGSTGIMRATYDLQVNPNVTIYEGNYYQMYDLLENQFWFYGLRYIPFGCYHDFMDDTNKIPNNPDEYWDVIQGVSIRQLYNAHNVDVINMQQYRCNFTGQNSYLNRADIDKIFDQHNVAKCN